MNHERTLVLYLLFPRHPSKAHHRPTFWANKLLSPKVRWLKKKKKKKKKRNPLSQTTRTRQELPWQRGRITRQMSMLNLRSTIKRKKGRKTKHLIQKQQQQNPLWKLPVSDDATPSELYYLRNARARKSCVGTRNRQKRKKNLYCLTKMLFISTRRALWNQSSNSTQACNTLNPMNLSTLSRFVSHTKLSTNEL